MINLLFFHLAILFIIFRIILTMSMSMSYLTHNGDDLYRLNYLKKLSRLKTELRIWSSRDITPIGRNITVKSFAISQLVFLFQVLPNSPMDFIENVEIIVYDLIWSGNPDKVKMSTKVNQIEDGGLKVIHIESFAYFCIQLG